MDKILIESVTAFTSTDADGVEGVLGQVMPDGSWMPFIFADPVNVALMLPVAINMSRMTKIPFRIIQFTGREDLTEKYTREYNEAIQKAKLN